jgi:hypothetical protein
LTTDLLILKVIYTVAVVRDRAVHPLPCATLLYARTTAVTAISTDVFIDLPVTVIV